MGCFSGAGQAAQVSRYVDTGIDHEDGLQKAKDIGYM